MVLGMGQIITSFLRCRADHQQSIRPTTNRKQTLLRNLSKLHSLSSLSLFSPAAPASQIQTFRRKSSYRNRAGIRSPIRMQVISSTAVIRKILSMSGQKIVLETDPDIEYIAR